MGLLDNFKSLLQSKVNIRSRFELLREAISGTMSSFYMARDRRTDKIVGLKILDRKKTEFQESRFKGLNKPSKGEIAIAVQASAHRRDARTRHHDQREQYIVMEFLEGRG